MNKQILIPITTAELRQRFGTNNSTILRLEAMYYCDADIDLDRLHQGLLNPYEVMVLRELAHYYHCNEETNA